MKSHYRVVVIGGGVVGASVLYHLAREGWTDVCLIERSVLTAGSSWHAAGGVHAINADPNIAALQAYTIDLLSVIQEESGQDIGLHMTGGMTLAGTPDRWEWLQSAYRVFQSIGIEDVHLITPEEAGKLCPVMSTDGILGGLWAEREGYIDTTGTVHAYAGAARKRGAEVIEHNRVLELNQTADGWEVVTEKGTINCEHVVNAGGLWAKQVGRMAGIELPVSPLNHHYLITETIPEVAELDRELPLVVDLEGFTYMRQDQKGMLLGIYEIDHDHWMMDGAPWEYGFELQQERPRPHRERTHPGLSSLSGAARGRDQDLGQRRLYLFARRQPAGGAGAGQARLLVRLRGDGRIPAGWRRRQKPGGVDRPRRTRGRRVRHGRGPLWRFRREQAVHSRKPPASSIHCRFVMTYPNEQTARRAGRCGWHQAYSDMTAAECPLGRQLRAGAAALFRALPRFRGNADTQAFERVRMSWAQNARSCARLRACWTSRPSRGSRSPARGARRGSTGSWHPACPAPGRRAAGADAGGRWSAQGRI